MTGVSLSNRDFERGCFTEQVERCKFHNDFLVANFIDFNATHTPHHDAARVSARSLVLIRFVSSPMSTHARSAKSFTSAIMVSTVFSKNFSTVKDSCSGFFSVSSKLKNDGSEMSKNKY